MIDESQEISNHIPESSSEGDAPRRRSRRRGRRGKSRGATSAGGEQQVEQTAESPADAVPQPHHREAPRPVEHRRSHRSGFADGYDRQVCVSRMPGYPTAWPVNYRTGLAMQPLIEVARTAESLLLCDLSHDGPCVWPGYLGSEPGASPEVVSAEAQPVLATSESTKPEETKSSIEEAIEIEESQV